MAELISPGVLQHDELQDFSEVTRRIDAHREHNWRRTQYYEAHRTVQDLGISTPPGLGNIGTVLGWPATVVDAL
ncbi:hypothetical protein, partial [Brevibacterium otitidis]